MVQGLQAIAEQLSEYSQKYVFDLIDSTTMQQIQYDIDSWCRNFVKTHESKSELMQLVNDYEREYGIYSDTPAHIEDDVLTIDLSYVVKQIKYLL